MVRKMVNYVTFVIFIDDKVHGETRMYWDNGNIREICSHYDNKIYREFKTYNRNGELSETYNFL
jgi:antitoxin component YwqK of YwqJK toxin-antitoxin module